MGDARGEHPVVAEGYPGLDGHHLGCGVVDVGVLGQSVGAGRTRRPRRTGRSISAVRTGGSRRARGSGRGRSLPLNLRCPAIPGVPQPWSPLPVPEVRPVPALPAAPGLPPVPEAPEVPEVRRAPALPEAPGLPPVPAFPPVPPVLGVLEVLQSPGSLLPRGPGRAGTPPCPVSPGAPTLPGAPRGPLGPRWPLHVGALRMHANACDPTFPVKATGPQGGGGRSGHAALANSVDPSTATTDSARKRLLQVRLSTT